MSLPRLKICHVAESFLPKLGGMQVVVDNLAFELAEREHDVTVVCPSYPGVEGPQPLPGYKISRCFGSTRLTFGLGVFAWRRLLAREHFDIVHAHNVWPGGTLALMARRFGAGLVVTSHGRDILTDPAINYGSRLKPRTAAIIRYTLGRVDVHTVVSASMIDSALAAGSAAENIEVVPNFMNKSVPPAANRQSEDSQSRERYLLMVGRLHKVKGLDIALRAFAQTRVAFPRLRLKIAGTGEEEAALRQLSADLGIDGSVDWLGQVIGAQKDQLTARAWAVLVTSRVESFCLAAIEAMAAGAPVIAPNRPPFTDIIGDQNGLLIEVDQPRSLVRALEQLAQPGEAARLAELGVQTAASFTRSSAVDQYEEIYYRLVGEKRSSIQTPIDADEVR